MTTYTTYTRVRVHKIAHGGRDSAEAPYSTIKVLPSDHPLLKCLPNGKVLDLSYDTLKKQKGQVHTTMQALCDVLYSNLMGVDTLPMDQPIMFTPDVLEVDLCDYHECGDAQWNRKNRVTCAQVMKACQHNDVKTFIEKYISDDSDN